MNYEMLKTWRPQEEGRRDFDALDASPTWHVPWRPHTSASLTLFSCDSSSGGWEDWACDRAAAHPRCIQRCQRRWTHAAALNRLSCIDFHRERKAQLENKGRPPPLRSLQFGTQRSLERRGWCCLSFSWLVKHTGSVEGEENSFKNKSFHVLLLFDCKINIHSL